MPCPDCSPNNVYNSNYQQLMSNSGCGNCTPTSNLSYDGPSLVCSEIESCDNLNDVISKLDAAICTAVGDYSTYNKYCLDDVTPILTSQQFVEAISSAHCTLKTNFENFVNLTFDDYSEAIDGRLDAIERPGITCTSASVLNTDTLQTVLTKYCVKFVAIDNLLNISSVDWDQCFTVPVAPTNIVQGFDLLIDQICAVKALVGTGGGGTLPVFNNVGSCLPAPLTTTDTLVNTVNKIKTRLCQSPVFDINALTWNCVTKPSSTTTDLQAAFQTVLTELQNLKQSFPSFDNSHFTVSNVDNSNLCLGKRIQLTAPPAANDRFVALNGFDLTPGFLENKLAEGAGVSFDLLANPGKLTIAASNVGGDGKVKLNLTDPTSGFLVDKIVAGPIAEGITVTVTPDTGTGQLKIGATIDMTALAVSLFTEIENNTELSRVLCNLMASCPSPCAPPSNVNVTYTP